MRIWIRAAVLAQAWWSPAFAQAPVILPASQLTPFKPFTLSPAAEPGKLPPLAGQARPMNPASSPGAAQGPNDWTSPKANAQITLPQTEALQKVDARTILVRKFGETTQIWCGPTILKDFGRNGTDADEIAKTLRELRPTQWGGIGGTGGRFAVEYGLTNGEAFCPATVPKQALTIDMKSVRAEAVRGGWVLRDDANIVLNFGAAKADAEQAAAVVQKYGFNRLGTVGSFQFFFAQSGVQPAQGAPAAVVKAMQEQGLARTGIDVPGVGFVGERIVLDPKKLETRKERGEWSLVHGSDVLAKCGASEWAARDALKMVQDMRFTEFCRFNAEITFFLVNGQAPSRVPFSVQSSRFDTDALKVRPATNGQWGVYEGNGRMVFTLAAEKEAEQLVKLLKHYRFDQTCQVGLSSRAGLKFLGKSAR